MESFTQPPEPARKKNLTQTISLIVGFILCVLGLCGLQFPAFAGLHLSIFFSLVTFIAGALLFWNGFKNYHARDSFLTCTFFGLFFGLNSLLGFVLGTEGMPSIGYQKADPLLFKMIPGYVELATTDHILNGIIALVLFGGAIDWWRRHKEQGLKNFRIRARTKRRIPQTIHH